MTRISPLPDLAGSPRPAPKYLAPLLQAALAVVGGVVGLGVAALVYRHIVDLGSSGPLVQDLLALDASHRSAGSISATAADSGSQLLYFGALVCATCASVLLLLGAGLAAAGAGHQRMAHRLTTIGLWLALSICLAAMLPMDGYPFALGLTDGSAPGAGPAVAQWHPASRALAITAGVGLLLASITAAPRSRTERSTARPDRPG